MSNDSNEALLQFEGFPADQAGDAEPTAPRRPGNPLAVVGVVLSFLPPVGLAVSAVGFKRARRRGGVGRRLAMSGLALSLLLGGVEAYVASTAPLLDAGCLDASSPADSLRALQASPPGDLTAMAAQLGQIHVALDGAVAKSGDAQARTKLQSVADDVQALGADLTKAQATGDLSSLVTDQTKLVTDGNAADSYCHSL
jgi:hypothetical protein